MDKVQKIREEVERLKSQLLRGACSSQIAMETRCKEEAYNEVLAIFDSLQEEPAPKVFEDMLNAKTATESLSISPEEYDKIVDECLYGKEPELVDFDDLPKEELVSEELEKSAKEYVVKEAAKDISGNWTTDNILNAFKAGANWQKLEDMGITNNAKSLVRNVLNSSDEPLDTYATEVAFMMLPANLTENYHMKNRSRISDAVRLGANWQKQKDNIPVSDDVEYASEKYSCRFSSSKYGHDKVKNAFIAGSDWKEKQFKRDCTKLCNGIVTAKGLAVTMAYDKGVEDAKKQLEKERLKHCDELTDEQAQIESDFVTQHLKDNNRTPTFIDAIEYGMRLKDKEMQSTIELAEDHAMLAGMEKMKEEMMAKAIDVEVKVDAGGYPYIPQIELYDYDKDVPLAKEGDKYKVILIKEG